MVARLCCFGLVAAKHTTAECVVEEAHSLQSNRGAKRNAKGSRCPHPLQEQAPMPQLSSSGFASFKVLPPPIVNQAKLSFHGPSGDMRDSD